jgi:hypothetical protein
VVPSSSSGIDDPSMPTRPCSVSFKGTSGIRHGVEVEESLYEAAVKAIALFRHDPWMNQLGTATPLDIEIRESTATTKHSVTLEQVESWLTSTSRSPTSPATRRGSR